MTLRLGLVGLPNVGKSTLLNALTRAGASVAPYPYTTIEPNVGIAALADSRLTALAEMVRPERVVPATVEFIDIAGLVRGAHRGEGLGNQFLGHIRNVSAVVVVARCFEDAEVPHVYGRVDPLLDLEVLDLELVLADLAMVERRLTKTRSAAKGGPRQFAAELAALESLKEALESGQTGTVWGHESNQMESVAAWNLLTGKPRLLVANVAEDTLPLGGPLARQIRERAQKEGSEAVVICAQTEMDLLDWPEEEAVLYLQSLGLPNRGLDRLVAACFRLLDLVTFLTITGGNEVRAWPVPRHTAAPAAAGRIHTDMERGFIRAEVVPVDELLAAGSWTAARDAGRVRVEGRSYLVQDGDAIHFRFAA